MPSDRPRVVLREVGEGDWVEWRALRLAALAEAPYAFSSTLAGWTGRGDIEARWRSRLADVPYNLVATVGEQAVGMVSCTQPVDGEAELISMWVAPDARGLGVGDTLIRAVGQWAAHQGATTLALSVRSANAHALTLYRRHGFVDAGPADSGVGDEPERRMRRRLASS